MHRGGDSGDDDDIDKMGDDEMDDDGDKMDDDNDMNNDDDATPTKWTTTPTKYVRFEFWHADTRLARVLVPE